MPKYLFDQQETITSLKNFFKEEKTSLNSFGNKVNQTFEAYTFAETIKRYQNNGWIVKIHNPLIKKVSVFRLKFTTRGAPRNFSYVSCEKGENKCQIRHQLRVSTKAYSSTNKYPANICCDVSIIKDIDLQFYSTNNAVPNKDLISFSEVKHMAAYAELIAGFIGMVHELQPKRLKKIRTTSWTVDCHMSPYLNVSGHLYGTAKGLYETIEKRKYDIDIYHYEKKIN
jgi:hypothetical protein